MVALVNATRVLGYARRHAEANMTSTVVIVRKLEPEFDESTGALAANGPIPVYSGKARVWSVSGPVRFSIGDEQAYFSSTFVSIPVVTESVPMIADLILVSAHPADPALVGRVFEVLDVEAGGQFTAARRMQVQGVAPSQQWLWPAAIDGAAGGAGATGGTGGMVVS